MRVGIIGHQDLGQAQEWCRTAVQEMVRTLPVTHGYTSLAAGADQLFADVLLAERIPYTAVIPSQDYEQTFSSEAARAHYSSLLQMATERIVLEFAAPSSEAFLAAGQRVVDCVQTVIAIWNGQAARGRGGTAEIVAFAREQGVAVVHCDPTLRAITQR